MVIEKVTHAQSIKCPTLRLCRSSTILIHSEFILWPTHKLPTHDTNNVSSHPHHSSNRIPQTWNIFYAFRAPLSFTRVSKVTAMHLKSINFILPIPNMLSDNYPGSHIFPAYMLSCAKCNTFECTSESLLLLLLWQRPSKKHQEGALQRFAWPGTRRRRNVVTSL